MNAHLVRYHARLRICKAKDACYLFSRMRQRSDALTRQEPLLEDERCFEDFMPRVHEVQRDLGMPVRIPAVFFAASVWPVGLQRLFIIAITASQRRRRGSLSCIVYQIERALVSFRHSHLHFRKICDHSAQRDAVVTVMTRGASGGSMGLNRL